MNDDALVECIARIIDPSSWAVMDNFTQRTGVTMCWACLPALSRARLGTPPMVFAVGGLFALEGSGGQ